MNWARALNEKLSAGKAAQFVCRQESIAPLVPFGSLCEVSHFDKRTLKLGDVVLCRVASHHKLCQISFVLGHRVEVTNGAGDQKWAIKMSQVTARLRILEEPLVACGM